MANGKIAMKTPLVEMDGDEMTRIIWQMIKDILILPFVELKTEYYDLGLKYRDETDDSVTTEAAEAIKRLGVGVKCATITPDADRIGEYGLKKMWKSPNGTIRAILDGTVFRAPIITDCVKPYVRNWKRPIIIARHAYGDVYRDAEYRVKGPGTAELVFRPQKADGGKACACCSCGNTGEERIVVHEFKGAGVVLGMHNLDSSISSFARSCFNYALDCGMDLWFSTKHTISKIYDHTFRDIFQEIYEKEYAARFTSSGINYSYFLVDDAVSRIIRSEGGMIWACKNYDGDVMSDMVATAYGSLAMMTSVLVSPDGYYEYEAAHGTVQRHYYKHLKGEETSTNSMATLFAWSGALRKRGELDDIKEMADFAGRLESASLQTIEEGVMTKDLAELADLPRKTVVNTEGFLKEVAKRL